MRKENQSLKDTFREHLYTLLHTKTEADMEAIDWMANNPYCIFAFFGLSVAGLIGFAIDCWRKR